MKWPTCSLGELAEFINGVAFRPDDWSEVGLRIVRIQNLTDPTKIYNRTLRKVDDRFVIHKDELLVSWSASLGVFRWSDEEPALVNQHIFEVVPKPRFVEVNYLRYVIERALIDMGQHLHGATMQHVNRGEFLATRIPLPPLDEQRRIAAILDQAEALRAKRRQASARLDTLTGVLFSKFFGDPAKNPMAWSTARLGNIALKFSDRPFGSNLKTEHYAASGIRVIRLQNIGINEFLGADAAFVSAAHGASLKKHVCLPGDVLVGTLGDPNLRACIQP